MPFDVAETPLPLHVRMPVAVMAFLGHLSRLIPSVRIAVDGPGRAGVCWIDLTLGELSPAVEWHAETGFGIYGPGPILPERPKLRLACPQAAALRLSRMLRSWGGAYRPGGDRTELP
ncbi:hypothetical protein [Plastoroseomonas hellenica]|uniref:hypothetical protein n=1 Tax=Plastoroseomonas hellenica TaxID=2687306 RepID=UPI001BAB8AA2|nr:hypothetical protein [Plastoroseomonas hellenica]MBR0643097.1 hypothetical protein [Plastoroseomonas hellenica]